MAFRTVRKKVSPEMANVTDKLASDSEELHVLAVDDSLVDRKVIERLLKISCCKVTAVESGIRALQYLGLDGEQSSVGSFDGLKVNLIMTDYSMPGMTGYELLKKLKTSSTLRKIPVVIMSSENIMARIDRCLEEGAEDFLVKPVKLSDVKRLKEYILKGEGDIKEMQMHKRKLNNDPSSVLPPARKLTDDLSSVLPPARKLNDDLSSVLPPARKLNDDPPSVPLPARKLNNDPLSVPLAARKLKDDPLSMLLPASSSLPSRLACELSPSILPCPSSSSPQSLSKRPRLKSLLNR